MKKWSYYNDSDPKICAWAKELIRAGLVPDGEVDCRSILDVRPYEIAGFAQQHFFCGILGWPLALKLAHWPDDKPVRTGSCPCQPFSCAGKQKGDSDERHLWPAFRELITFGESTITFGEQVASPLGRLWLSRVRADLEGLGYAFGAADLCAAGISAPHIRQRLFWMAHSQYSERWTKHKEQSETHRRNGFGRGGELGVVANRIGARLEGRSKQSARQECASVERSGDAGGLVLANDSGSQPWKSSSETARHRSSAEPASGNGRLGNTESGGRREQRDSALARNGGHSDGSNPWSNFDICHFTGYEAGKTRRIESGSCPLVAGLPRGMVPSGDPSYAEAQATAEFRGARLRGYGNSIVPQLAAQFIQAALESI